MAFSKYSSVMWFELEPDRSHMVKRRWTSTHCGVESRFPIHADFFGWVPRQLRVEIDANGPVVEHLFATQTRLVRFCFNSQKSQTIRFDPLVINKRIIGSLYVPSVLMPTKIHREMLVAISPVPE